MTEHTQHCDHEEFCRFFFHDSKIAVHDGTPCMRNHDGCAKCSYDSRTSATPAPAPSCEDNGCTDPEACDEICEHSRIYSPAWVKQHDKEEREKMLKGILMAMNDPQLSICDTGYLEHTYWVDYIKSLRTTKEKPHV